MSKAAVPDEVPLDTWRLVHIPGKGQGARASEFIPAGTVVAACGVTSLQTWRDDRSIQVTSEVHVHTEVPGCQLNHSCKPNLRIVDVWPNRIDGQTRFELWWVARRDIQDDEELTWHYATSEAYSVSVEECRCGHCDGSRVRGFHERPKREQGELIDIGVLSHLR